jgi:hypothetical protein
VSSRPDWKGFPRANPLAYWASWSVTKEKSFIRLTPDGPGFVDRDKRFFVEGRNLAESTWPNVIKLFTAVSYEVRDKLECLSLASFLSLV